MNKDDAAKLANRYLGWLDNAEREQPKRRLGWPRGDKILLRQKPDAPGRVLFKSAEEQIRPFAGLLVGAGDQAADVLYDGCDEMGDEVWIGKYYLRCGSNQKVPRRVTATSAAHSKLPSR